MTQTDRDRSAFRGHRLRVLRHERGISADKLGKMTGLTTHHIYRLERGNRPHTWGTTVAKLPRAFDTTLEYLLGLTDDPRLPRAWAVATESQEVISR